MHATLIKAAKKPPAAAVAPPAPADRPMPPRMNRTPAHLETRELTMPDGKRLTVARHAIHLIVEAREKGRVIVGVKGTVGAMPVTADYEELLAWWQERRAP